MLHVPPPTTNVSEYVIQINWVRTSDVESIVTITSTAASNIIIEWYSWVVSQLG